MGELRGGGWPGVRPAECWGLGWRASAGLDGSKRGEEKGRGAARRLASGDLRGDGRGRALRERGRPMDGMTIPSGSF